MIPKRDGRSAGTGGGGKGGKRSGFVLIPFFCKRCGKQVHRKQAQESVDVCKKCRVRK